MHDTLEDGRIAETCSVICVQERHDKLRTEVIDL
jgi:hypothetical protein